MKKLTILALALLLVCAFATVALADNSHYPSGTQDSSVWLTTTQTVFPHTTPSTVPYTPKDPVTKQPIPVHSNFTANTDACAACHSPHYAQDLSGLDKNGNPTSNLLQAVSPSLLCITCHDGTVASTYDVISGTFTDQNTKETYRNNAGLFAVTNDGSGVDSSSQHDVFSGTALLSSAPGGKGTNAQSLLDQGTWDGTLECTSCHDPHDTGGNPRLLNPDPNGVMQMLSGVSFNQNYDPSLKTHKYYFDATNANSAFLATYSTQVELQDLTDISVPNQSNYSTRAVVKVNGTAVKQYSMGWDASQGSYYVTINDDALSGPVTVDYLPVMVVNGSISGKLTAAETENGFNKSMSAFCASCHVSFVGPRSASNPGIYTNDYHHTSDPGNSSHEPVQYYNWNVETSCLSCHVAHGVDNQYWLDETRTGLYNNNAVYKGVLDAAGFQANTAGKVAPAATNPNAGFNATAIASADSTYNPFYAGEFAGNSSLKRLPNMGVCESCHNRGLLQGSDNNIYFSVK